jgi:hypothetical protein
MTPTVRTVILNKNVTHWAVKSDSRTKAWYWLATYCDDSKCE